MSRILGIDYGRARIGVAVSDETALISKAVGIIKNEGSKKSAAKIGQLIEEYEVSKVVVGLSKKSDGMLGEIGVEALEFGKYLGVRFNIPIDFIDEAMTTKNAESIMIESRSSRKSRKQRIDTVAACLILQDYLDRAKEL
ncbi:MAG: Holliday junction resolvase RuvX [Elusimicrobiota bacterium]